VASSVMTIPGLDLFRRQFESYADQYVLIGGCAATLTMENAGLAFRATKDLDIVLHIEALTPAFAEHLWAFIKAGRYVINQRSNGTPQLHRFQKPADAAYPAMLELFCRKPGGLQLADEASLTPIPMDEAVSSLSAILLDDDYSEFIMAGRRTVDGLPWVGEDRLIPLKASAWLDLSRRVADGEPIDGKKVRKHLNDVLRLAQLLTPASRVALPQSVSSDLRRFVERVRADGALDLKTLGIQAGSVSSICDRILTAFTLG
jgi:hypothetical protein